MAKINQVDYQKSLDRLSDILSGITVQADVQSQTRCPYKNKDAECTALIGCKNQRPVATEDGRILLCRGDDKLDYRSAWESDPASVERAREALHSPDKAGTKTLFDLADELALHVPTSCGRGGICHECIVEVHAGMESLSVRNEAESFLSDSFRLACQARLEGNESLVDFSVLRRKPKILIGGELNSVAPSPLVTRAGDSVFYNDDRIDRYTGHIYGLAIDLGTTTITIEVVDLETGKEVKVIGFENPQRFGGSDVMSRISYDGKNKGELWRSVTNAINYALRHLENEDYIDPQEIYEIVIVGNSTMRDILFKLDVQTIGQKPYRSLTEYDLIAGKRSSTSLRSRPARLGIKINRSAKVYSPPLISSHVGADTLADLVAIDMASSNQTIMLVDVGTNTEVVIQHEGRILCASCPAGPAFEGGLVKYGMPAYEGAIDSFAYRDGEFSFTTIGDSSPVGICGSGLIDLLAELRRHNLMTKKGVFADKRQFELKVVPSHGITLSREDASNLAQAKSANYSGQLIVMRELGVDAREIETLYLAGGFANYVNVRSAIEIGFLPPVPEDRIKKIGNAAAQGARQMLVSEDHRGAAEEFARKIEHVELETTPDFFEVFVDGCQFNPMPQHLAKFEKNLG